MTTEDMDNLIGKLESFHWKADCDYCPMRDDCETDKCLLSLAVEAIETLREDKAALEVLLRDRPEVEWIPVTVRLPEAEPGCASESVIVTDGEIEAFAECFNFESCERYWSYTGIGEITHWAPRPKLPVREEAGDEQ